MPNLTEPEQINEQRKVIKFWIDHCSILEKEIESLRLDRDKWREAYHESLSED